MYLFVRSITNPQRKSKSKAKRDHQSIEEQKVYISIVQLKDKRDKVAKQKSTRKSDKEYVLHIESSNTESCYNGHNRANKRRWTKNRIVADTRWTQNIISPGL